MCRLKPRSDSTRRWAVEKFPASQGQEKSGGRTLPHTPPPPQGFVVVKQLPHADHCPAQGSEPMILLFPRVFLKNPYNLEKEDRNSLSLCESRGYVWRG